MKSLYLRIYLTVVVALALFAAGSAWLFHDQVQTERGRIEAQVGERIAAWGDLIQRSLPAADAPPEQQASALREWSQRLRVPMALDDAQGQRIGASDSYLRRSAEMPGTPRGLPVRLDDGRTLWVLRGPMQMMREGGGAGRAGPGGPGSAQRRIQFLPPWLHGTGLAAILVLLFLAVAAGAYPVVRRLTRRLETLQKGVETFGSGQLSHRVDAGGNDEVGALAGSFNSAAQRIETLVQSHRSLLANASHELRSPLTRMKLALAMQGSAGPDARPRLQAEIEQNIRELDALVEEVLLASRLDAPADPHLPASLQPVALLPLAAEEGARVQASVEGDDASVRGDERLLRRAFRNLLENARRYGGGVTPELEIVRQAASVQVRVCDRGPGVPESLRERIFEPFYRLPGHAEQAGGAGLGLSLVRQIASAHQGSVHCEARAGGGSVFVLTLPS